MVNSIKQCIAKTAFNKSWTARINQREKKNKEILNTRKSTYDVLKTSNKKLEAQFGLLRPSRIKFQLGLVILHDLHHKNRLIMDNADLKIILMIIAVFHKNGHFVICVETTTLIC